MRVWFSLLLLVLVCGCVGSPPNATTTTVEGLTTIQGTTLTTVSTTSIDFAVKLSECYETENSRSRDKCYLEVATAKLDSSVCKKIWGIYDKDACYERIVVALNDSTLCGKIQRNSTKDSCYKRIAVELTDPSICRKIQKQSWEDLCYGQIAVALNGPTLCDKIKYQKTKDECYSSIGIALNDSSICGRLEDFFWRDWCYRGVGVNTSTLYEGEEVKCDDRCLADSYFIKAQECYEAIDFTCSLDFAEVAKELYHTLGDSESVQRCERIINQMEKYMKGCTHSWERRAREHYTQGQHYYVARKYNTSLTHLKAAKSLYEKCGEPEDVSKCESLEKAIQKKRLSENKSPED